MGKKIIFGLLALFLVNVTMTSCTSDEEIEKRPVSEEYTKIAKEILKDSIVFQTKAMQSTINKTLLENGCPVKYHFSWVDENTLNVRIKSFTVGKMPVMIWYNINCRFMRLNSWEKEEYKGDGWIKFQGDKGRTDYEALESSYQDGDGGDGYTTGYINVLTKEIEVAFNFNVMAMQCFVFRQKVDYSKMDTYEKDFAQFEKDLAKYKEEHGL